MMKMVAPDQPPSLPLKDGSAPTQDLRAELNAAVHEARRGQALILETLKHFGFERIGTASISEKTTHVYRDPSGDFAFGFVDDFVVPGRDSLACAGVVHLGNRSMYLVLLPSPSAQLMSDLVELSLADSPQSAQSLRHILGTLSCDSRREIVSHEMTHIDDYKHALWGQVAFMQQLVGSGLSQINLSQQMAERLLPRVPSEEESRAATLLLELKAFCSNTKTDPSRSQVARDCCEKIEAAPKNPTRADTLISEQLGTWQRCLSSPGSTYVTGGLEEIKIAVGWLLEQGTLYPEKQRKE